MLTLLNEASIYTSKSPFPSMSEKRDVKEGQRADTSQYDEGLYDESYNEYLDLKIDYDQFKQIMMMNNDDQASTVTVTPRNNGNQSFSAVFVLYLFYSSSRCTVLILAQTSCPTQKRRLWKEH